MTTTRLALLLLAGLLTATTATASASAAPAPDVVPAPDVCAQLRADVDRWLGTMRAEGAVFEMATAGCPNPPYDLLPPP